MLYFQREPRSSLVTDGNYTGTVVRDNVILGGFATDEQDSVTETKGENDDDAIIKSVIASALLFRLLNIPLSQDRHCDWTSDLVR